MSKPKTSKEERERAYNNLYKNALSYQAPATMAIPHVKIGRNADCPCGSGKKFKKCCVNKPGTWQTVEIPKVEE